MVKCVCGLQLPNIVDLQMHQIDSSCDRRRYSKDGDLTVTNGNIGADGDSTAGVNGVGDSTAGINGVVQSTETNGSIAGNNTSWINTVPALSSSPFMSEVSFRLRHQSETQELMENYSRFTLESESEKEGEEEVNDMFNDDMDAEEFLDMMVNLMQQMGKKLVEKDVMIEQLEKELNDKTDNIIYFLDKNNILRNIVKQKNEETQQLQELIQQQHQTKQKQLDVSTAASTSEEECCCCTTTVRGLTKLRKYVQHELGNVKQKLEQIDNRLSPIDQGSKANHVNRNDSPTHISNPDISNTSHKQFAWEEHSKDVARKTLERMGYKGTGGLGKNEDGIVEAITIDNIKPTKKKTLIFSSSITRGINPNGFNKKLEGGSATFHKFNGKKASHIRQYIPVHLKEESHHGRMVDSVVMVAGGNDIPMGKFNSMPVSKIADDLIEASLLCKEEYGVKHIYISSILPRTSVYYQLRRKELNNILKERCSSYGFTFIDNANIILKHHIGPDGVHLNKAGSSLLCRNLHRYLNGKE